MTQRPTPNTTTAPAAAPAAPAAVVTASRAVVPVPTVPLPLVRAFSTKKPGSSGNGPSVAARLVRLAAALGVSVLLVSALAGVAVAWTVHSNAKILDVVVPLSELDRQRISATLDRFGHTWNTSHLDTKRIWAATKAGQLSWALLMLLTSEEEGSTEAARSFDLSDVDDDVIPMSVSRAFILKRLSSQCANGSEYSSGAELLSNTQIGSDQVDPWQASAKVEDINLAKELDFTEDHDVGASDGAESESRVHSAKKRARTSQRRHNDGSQGKASAEEAVALEMLSSVLAPFLSICQRASSRMMPAAFQDEDWSSTQTADKVRAVDWIIGAIHAVAAFRLLTPTKEFKSPGTKSCFKGKDPTALGVRMPWGTRADQLFAAMDLDGSKRIGRAELLEWLRLLRASRKVVAVAEAAMDAGERSNKDFLSIYTEAVLPLASVDLDDKVDELLAKTSSGTLTLADVDVAFMHELQEILMGTNEETSLHAQASESEFLVNN
eukprot:INCI18046.6.p2 GENE.INCI18046.6~~INCI18046.6.p2  ORF type:complete len:494 (-),score=90.59 INCI18046.6:2046-3527(-)